MAKITNPSKNGDSGALDRKLDRDVRMGSEGDNLRDATVKLYVRQLKRIYSAGRKEHQWDADEFVDRIHFPRMYDDVEFKRAFSAQKSDVISVLMSIYTAKESLIMSLNALCKMTKNRFKQTFDYYNKIRKVLSKQNKSDKLNNELTPDEESKYISYEELMAVPGKVKHGIIQSHGKLFLSKAELDALGKTAKPEYLKSVFDYFALYVNINYPLRLVWPSVLLHEEEGMNYLLGDKLHLNDFKNVRLMEPQVLTIDSKTMALIKEYLGFIRNTLGRNPTKILWRVYNGIAGEYSYTPATSGGFSQVLSRLFVKYNGKPMTMNVIRHIVESHIIQSPSYSKLTNKEKNDLHAKLLHSSYAANISYNKIANRTRVEPDYSFEPEITERVSELSITKPPKQSRPQPRPTQMEPLIPIRVGSRQKRRIFSGQFTPSGSDRDIEIEIFEKA